MQVYLMTMAINSVDPFYHGLVEITDGGLIVSEGYNSTPIEDFGCWFYSEKSDDVPTDRDSMVSLFLEFMAD